MSNKSGCDVEGVGDDTTQCLCVGNDVYCWEIHVWV